jgi:2-polyprenyl-3-methyl-5-hydroxy-6-metoxy-1,4-benzoquinol methylase
MMANDVLACVYCGAVGAIRQICEKKYVSGGLPFSCTRCGGSFFSRTVVAANSDEYWEEDPVNKQVYIVPEVREAFQKKYERYLAMLDGLRGSGTNLLEVGCGAGIFLAHAAKWGWVGYGLDISPQAVQMTRQSCPGATVVCAPLEKSGFSPETFDLIALWDVIEHVDDPEALLNQVRRLLRPGGMVVMETPDEGCASRALVRFIHKVTGGRVSQLRAMYYEAHRWYFSRGAMSKLLRRVGFDHIQIRRECTVSEFGQRKGEAYGFSKLLLRVAYKIMNTVPVLRNKMVVMAAKY